MVLDRPRVDAMVDTELFDQDPLQSPLRPLKRVPSFSSRPGFPSGLQVRTAAATAIDYEVGSLTLKLHLHMCRYCWLRPTNSHEKKYLSSSSNCPT